MARGAHKGRIAFLGQYFPPESGAPETSFDIAKGLSEIGYAVQVITALPNYPTGKIFPGYPKLRSVREEVRGLPTIRAPLFPSHNSSGVSRATNYLSFMASSAAVGRRYLSTSDLNFIISSPATLDAVGVLYRALSGRPYVLFVQDLWPDSVFATGFLVNTAMRGLVEPPLERYCRATLRNAAAVIAISDMMRETIIDRGVPPERVHTVYNWAQESVFYPRERSGALRSLLGLSETDMVLMFSGNIGAAQDLEPWVRAFTSGGLPPEVHLVLQGDGERKDSLLAMATGCHNVHFLPRRPLAEAVELEADADALVISLARDPLFEMTVPSKVANSLASGAAVVATVAGEAARVLTESGAAIVGEPGSVESIVRIVNRSLKMGAGPLSKVRAAGYRFYQEHLSRHQGLLRLSETMERATRIQA